MQRDLLLLLLRLREMHYELPGLELGSRCRGEAAYGYLDVSVVRPTQPTQPIERTETANSAVPAAHRQQRWAA